MICRQFRCTNGTAWKLNEAKYYEKKHMEKGVQDQTYANWELCMTDASDDQHKNVGRNCTEYAEKDECIRYKELKKPRYFRQ